MGFRVLVATGHSSAAVGSGDDMGFGSAGANRG